MAALAKCSLRVLKIDASRSGMSTEVAEALAKSLASLTKELRTLELAFDGFFVCEAGLRAIVATLGKLQLTALKLNLCGCEEGSQPLQAFEISQALGKMPHLQSLELSGGPVGSEALPTPATHAILRYLKAGGKVCQAGGLLETL